MSIIEFGPVPEDEEIYERRMRVLSKRLAGHTFDRITMDMNAERAKAGLGSLSSHTYRKDHRAALKEISAASRDEMIAQESAVLLELRRAHLPTAVARASVGDDEDGRAYASSIDSARVVLSTTEQMRKLWGLDAPSQVQVGIGEVEFAERLYAAMVEIGTEPPKEIAQRSQRGLESGEAVDAPVLAWSNVDGSVL